MRMLCLDFNPTSTDSFYADSLRPVGRSVFVVQDEGIWEPVFLTIVVDEADVVCLCLTFIKGHQA